MKSIKLQNLKVGGEDIVTEAEIPENLSELGNVQGKDGIVVDGDAISLNLELSQGDFNNPSAYIINNNYNGILFASEATDVMTGYFKDYPYKVSQAIYVGDVWLFMGNSLNLSTAQLQELNDVKDNIEFLKHFIDYSNPTSIRYITIYTYEDNNNPAEKSYKTGVYKLTIDFSQLESGIATSTLDLIFDYSNSVDLSNYYTKTEVDALLPISVDISGEV